MNNNIVEEFKCKKCGVIKSIDNFSKRKLNKYGINYVCKDCMKSYNKALKDSHVMENLNRGLPERFICKRCGEEKSIDNFKKKKEYKLGHSTICNECNEKRINNRKVPDSKFCSLCGIEYPISFFQKRKDNKDGYLNWCNKCNAIGQRRYRENRTIEQKNKDLEYHKKRKLEKVNYVNNILISKGCSICGYNKSPAALEFHHRDPNEKFKEVSYLAAHGFDFDIIDREIDKCDIVCSNCHREITAKELNRYK